MPELIATIRATGRHLAKLGATFALLGAAATGLLAACGPEPVTPYGPCTERQLDTERIGTDGEDYECTQISPSERIWARD